MPRLSQYVIPYRFTTAQVLTLGTAPITFATLAVNTALVRVPVGLSLCKPAGTAYTVAAGARLRVLDDDNNVLFDLAAEGFLDQATLQCRYVKAATSGRAFSANSYVFTLSSTGALTVGTSPLLIEAEFEEYGLTLATA
jgi:hypothetical protein